MGDIYIDFSFRIGEKSITKEGYESELTEYFSKKNCTIVLSDGTVLYKKWYRHFKDGKLKNPYHKSVFNIGYLGEGFYKTKALNKNTKCYNTWLGFLERVYSKKAQEKRSTYIGCSVYEKWCNFQVFAEWFTENYDPEIMQGWHLDKDILVKGNKVYSPETCCFVPQEINVLFTKNNINRGEYPIGVNRTRTKYNAIFKHHSLGMFNTPEEAFEAYKTAKEAYIKEVANKWRGKIEEKVYQAMYNYQVEITD